MKAGETARITDGKGRLASGRIVSLTKDAVIVAVESIVVVPRPTPLALLAPVADKERMLLLAEKCVELQITSWHPVYFARSRSVSPRGEGPKFAEKLLARMRSALEQSGGAWLPEVHQESESEPALESAPRDHERVILDASGDPIALVASNASTYLAVGPEGGLEPSELATAARCGWRAASLGSTTLRFETAALAGVAVIRATQLNRRA